MPNKKSQAVATDLAAAIFIAILVLTIILSTFNTYTVRLDKKVDYLRMSNKAYQISEVLVKTQGMPVYWENNISALQDIGLALTDRNLSQAKIDAFINLSNTNYSLASNLLGLEGYNYTFSIKNLSGAVINSTDVAPRADRAVVSMQRRVLLGTGIKLAEVKVWK